MNHIQITEDFPATITIGSLSRGDYFLHQGKLYLCCSVGGCVGKFLGNPIDAVCLNDATKHTFHMRGLTVIPVDVKLTVYRGQVGQQSVSQKFCNGWRAVWCKKGKKHKTQ